MRATFYSVTIMVAIGLAWQVAGRQTLASYYQGCHERQKTRPHGERYLDLMLELDPLRTRHNWTAALFYKDDVTKSKEHINQAIYHNNGEQLYWSLHHFIAAQEMAVGDFGSELYHLDKALWYLPTFGDARLMMRVLEDLAKRDAKVVITAKQVMEAYHGSRN